MRRVAAAALALCLAAAPWVPVVRAEARPLARRGAYVAALHAGRALWAVRLAGHRAARAGCVEAWVPPGETAEPVAVAAAAAGLLHRVARALELDPQDVELACRRAGPVIVVLYRDPGSLARHFGVGGAPAEGVYRLGVVGVLGPSTWGDGADGLARFAQRGALAHELAHFLVDARSAGRVPAWLSEGMAQLADLRVTGYVWDAPVRGGPYSLGELEGRFERLDPARAYRQAVLLALELERRGGPGTLAAAVRALDRGGDPRGVLAAAAGLAPQEIAVLAARVDLQQHPQLLSRLAMVKGSRSGGAN